MFKIQHSLNEPRFRIKRVFLVIFALLLLINIAVPLHAASDQPLVYVLEVEKTVTFGTARYIERGLEEAQSKGADACIISLNTPGGLVDATLEIIQDMSAARIPVITYVNPEGGIAASAGTFILLNGHIAAMAPGTTCGAAMPVTISPSEEGTQAADQKTINFLAGHMKSIADQRGRPADLAGKFVTDNLVLNNREALEKGVIDYVAADKEELLNKIHDTAVTINGQEIVLRTAGAQIVTVSHNTSEKVTNLISDPTLSMLFLTIGVMGLLIGFYSLGFSCRKPWEPFA